MMSVGTRSRRNDSSHTDSTVLNDLLNGREIIESLLVIDSSMSAGPLLRTSLGVRTAISKKCNVVQLALEASSWNSCENVQVVASAVGTEKISLTNINASIDPLDWSKKVSSSMEISSNVFIPLTSCIDNLETLIADVEKCRVSSDSSSVLIIDSLSPLLLYHPTSSVCRTIQRLSRSFRAVIAGVHNDIHNSSTMAAISYCFRSSVRLRRRYALHEAWAGGDVIDGGVWDVSHRRHTGKVISRMACHIVWDSMTAAIKVTKWEQTAVPKHDSVSSGSAMSISNPISGEPSISSTITSNSSSDPTADLSFNLRLTPAQEQARDKVELPYLRTSTDGTATSEASTGGMIYYQPDEADDLDDSDPDDDLDF